MMHEEYDILDKNVWNMNKTGFCIGCERGHMIITLHKMKEFDLHDLDNRTYVTSAECISADDLIISAFIIISERVILQAWSEENNIKNNNTVITVSDTGYSNIKLTLK